MQNKVWVFYKYNHTETRKEKKYVAEDNIKMSKYRESQLKSQIIPKEAAERPLTPAIYNLKKILH